MAGQIATPSSSIGFLLDLSGVSDRLTLAVNQLAGRSRVLDHLISASLHNDLVKGTMIGACFFAAWFAHSAPADAQRARKILITTLIATVLALGVSKAISHAVFLPRPFIQTQKLYLLQGDRLVEGKRLPYRTLQDHSSRAAAHDLREGTVDLNDLGTFPSDHASFFVTVSLGIFLVARAAGLIALAWTFFVILASKVISGHHTALDVVSGVAIAVVVLAGCQVLARRWMAGLLDRAALWTLRHVALSSALLFVVVFEIASTLTHLPPLLAAIARLALGAGK